MKVTPIQETSTTSLNINDLLEINQLISRYFLATDSVDLEAFMDCWVEADRFGGYDLGQLGNLNTREELYNYLKKHHNQGLADAKRHISTNIKFNVINATEVWLTQDMIVVEIEDNPDVFITGRYNYSSIVKTEQGWKFKSRKLPLDSGSLEVVKDINSDWIENE
jgi:uncharacterized protein YhdP